MKRKLAKELIKSLPISLTDITRLMIECLEELGEHFMRREEMMQRLRKVLREGVSAVRAAEHTESFETVAWASVEARRDRRKVTQRDLRCFVRRMLRVRGMAQMPLRKMSVHHCRMLLHEAFGSSAHSYRKGRAILHSIFAFGMRREWCDANPVDRIETPSVQEHPIAPLTPDEVARLTRAARRPEHAPMRFSLHLMLCCGLRPNEVRRLKPEDIHWDEDEIFIRPSVSKTGGGRVVPLRRYASGPAACIPKNWETRWRRLRAAAGFRTWRADVCRHSFASYHASHFCDLHALQMEMGHAGLHLLRSRYLYPVSKKAAQRYWELLSSA